MKTTRTLDDDVAQLLESAAHRERKSFKAVVNDAIRRALSPSPVAAAKFVVTPHETGLVAGFDRQRLNELADELEVEAFLDGHRPPP